MMDKGLMTEKEGQEHVMCGKYCIKIDDVNKLSMGFGCCCLLCCVVLYGVLCKTAVGSKYSAVVCVYMGE